MISLARGKGAPSRPWRPALLLLLGLALALMAACGGGGETTGSPPQGTARPSASPAASPQPSGTAAAEPWAAVRQVIQRFVPDSTVFKAYIPRITDIDRPNVDLSIAPAFADGKLHVIQFSDRGETFVVGRLYVGGLGPAHDRDERYIELAACHVKAEGAKKGSGLVYLMSRRL